MCMFFYSTKAKRTGCHKGKTKRACSTAPSNLRAELFEHNDSVAGGHSGSSYAYVMRLMQYIATHGFAQFKNDYLRDR